MAKRRRLQAPSAEQLDALEEGFARETRAGALGPIPPIAQVAADAAAQGAVAPAGDRAVVAQDQADALRYREALADGLVVQRVAISDILVDELARDRVEVDPEAMAELKASIALHGLRMPIDLFPLAGEGGARFGLISGWRRLMAYRALAAEKGGSTFDQIPAFIRDTGTGPKAYVAMVEENEVRANLSHYERGRIAVMAVSHGAFPNVGEAVNALYESGSKAKRSKIRSFAELHEALGDMLSFPTHLSERQGLRLVSALRNGMTNDIRAALAEGQGDSAAAEWAVMEPFVLASEGAAPKGKRAAKKQAVVKAAVPEILANGVALKCEGTPGRFEISIGGDKVDDVAMRALLEVIKAKLSKL